VPPRSLRPGRACRDHQCADPAQRDEYLRRIPFPAVAGRLVNSGSRKILARNSQRPCRSVARRTRQVPPAGRTHPDHRGARASLLPLNGTDRQQGPLNRHPKNAFRSPHQLVPNATGRTETPGTSPGRHGSGKAAPWPGSPAHHGDARVTRVSRADDLIAEGEPEAEFVVGVAARMPRKRMAAGALIRDERGRVLLVEPVYKPVWDLPGGAVEDDESPLEGCRRELLEELGLEIPVLRLLVVDWVPRQGVWSDALLFVFDGGILSPDRATAIRLQEAELSAARFVTLDDAAGHLPPSALRRLRAALARARSGHPGPAYLEFGRPVRTA
jgi:ADP-ribose pyrophosphatase YjhB (NUDIX family)